MPRNWDRSRFAPWLLRKLVQVNEKTTSRLCRLTIIRPENPAFNYGFFRPNPLSFAGNDQKNAGHGRKVYSLKRAGTSQPESCCPVELKETGSAFQRVSTRRPAGLPLSNPSPSESGHGHLGGRKK